MEDTESDREAYEGSYEGHRHEDGRLEESHEESQEGLVMGWFDFFVEVRIRHWRMTIVVPVVP